MKPETRILFNLSWLRPGQVGGTETYASRLLAALSDHGNGLKLDALGTKAALDVVESRGARLSGRVICAEATRAKRVMSERTKLKALSRQMDPDLVHHLGGTAPDLGGKASVVTVHDLQPLVHPENFSMAKQVFLRAAIPRAVQRADAVIAPSHYVANAIRERFGLDDAKVFAVPVYGSMPAAVAMPTIDKPFLLYPAMTMAHKNHRVLFEAFRQARKERPELRLVCTGTKGANDAVVRELAVRTRGVVMMGLVASDVFAGLLAAAEAMVYPSLFEGFGLPIIEAQSVGTVVYSSNATCLPEVMGYRGRLLDPRDVDAWAEAMVAPLHGHELAAEVERGRINAGRYSPENTARAQLQAYQAVLSQE